MDFWRVIAILNKRKALILLSVLITTVLTYGATRMVGSKWVATVRFTSTAGSAVAVLTGQENPADAQRGMIAAKQEADAYTSIVKSKEVLAPALAKLHTGTLPEELYRNIEFEAISPRLYELHVTDTSPSRGEALANALAEGFLQRQNVISTGQARAAVEVLEEMLKKVDAKLKRARAEHDKYRAAHQIFSAGTGNVKLESILSRTQTLAQQRDTLLERLAAIEGQIRAMPTAAAITKSIPVPAKVSSTQSARTPDAPNPELALIDGQIKALSRLYTATHPRVKEAIARRNSLLAKIEAENLTKVSAAPFTSGPSSTQIGTDPEIKRQEQLEQRQELIRELAAVKSQIAVTNASISKAEGETSRFKGLDGPLAALAATVAEHTEARANLVARLNSARMALDGAARQKPLAISAKVDEFNPPVNITQGRTKKLMLFGLLCALIGTSGLVVAFDSIDRRLRTVNEAQSVLPGRILTSIPQPLGEVSYSSLARATELHPQSQHSEAFRFLAHELLSANGSKARSIMVVSAQAEQGSTTTLTNLGITLAQAGKKVIVVDANVRTSELHTVFGLENEVGYMDLLKDPDPDAIDGAVKSTSVQNLEIITSGTVPGNPWALFHSGNLKRVSEALLSRADYVLYDTPSALLFTDSLNLAPVVDGAFLCVRAYQPLTGAEKRLVSLLEQSNVEILGSVLTDIPLSIVEGYDNYQHYYAAPLETAGRDHSMVAGATAAPGSLIVQAKHRQRPDGRSDSTGDQNS